MARVRLKVDIEGVRVDEVIEGATDSEIARKMREELARRAGFVKGAVIRSMPDETLWARVVELYNRQFGGSEPTPRTASDFLAFGERAGYVTRLR